MNLANKYRLICGMETHAELKTKSKMFCGCKNDPFGASKPNIYTCPTCLGMPGGLPVPNKTAIEWTIKLGLALGCKINLFSKFDRKNYFYPDLAKGYQISQYDIPFCYDGVLKTSEGPVRIHRIHLEEDTGKLMHTEIDGKKVSLVDFNRGGVPLIEIVTEPDIHSPSQAKEYGRKLRQILRYLQISDADMEQGGMRLEANISLAPTETSNLPNYKVEVKNINSFRFVEAAILFETNRHAEILNNGETPIQETRGWNAIKSETFAQRTKEEAEDYRYFPDPDIPPIRFTKIQIEKFKKEIPELPDKKAERWISDFGISDKNAQLLTQDFETANWLDQVFPLAKQGDLKANDVANALANKKIPLNPKASPKQVISQFKKMNTSDDVPEAELTTIISEIIEENQDAVVKYRSGDTKVLGFFMGQTLRKIGKKVDSSLLRNTIQKLLEQ